MHDEEQDRRMLQLLEGRAACRVAAGGFVEIFGRLTNQRVSGVKPLVDLKSPAGTYFLMGKISSVGSTLRRYLSPKHRAVFGLVLL